MDKGSTYSAKLVHMNKKNAINVNIFLIFENLVLNYGIFGKFIVCIIFCKYLHKEKAVYFLSLFKINFLAFCSRKNCKNVLNYSRYIVISDK
jgi:hypothetical protein